MNKIYSSEKKASLTRKGTERNSFQSTSTVISHKAQLVVSHPTFEKLTLMVICCNAAWIGFDVDWNDSKSPVPPSVFVIGENSFCFLFTMELIFRFFTYTNKINFFIDPETWKSNMFDLFLVTLMILEVWILVPLASNQHLNQFAVVRLLRLLRLLRISRIFRMVPELGMMVKNMAKAMRSVTSTLLLEVGVIYVFAVIFTQWTKSHPDPCLGSPEGSCVLNELFGTILSSFVTLMQILVFDDTFAIIRPILDDTWYMGCLLLLFMVLGAWTVLNMLIGIICEIIVTGTAEEKMKMLELRVREVFATIDLDGSGTVTREEFNGAAIKQLVALGISKEVMNNAFDILDEDGSGSFDIDEFLGMIFKLLNPPQSQDIEVLNRKMTTMATQLNIPTAKLGKGRSFGRSFTNSQLGKSTTKQSLGPEAMGQGEPSSPAALYELLQSRPKSDSSPASNRNGSKDVPVAALHPFAPPDPSPQSLEVPPPPDSPPLSLDADVEKEILSLETSQAQAQEIYEQLKLLSQSVEKAENALKLVHGWKSWEKASDERVESVLKVTGLHDLSEDDRTKATDLVRQYHAALGHRQVSNSSTSPSTNCLQQEGSGKGPPGRFLDPQQTSEANRVRGNGCTNGGAGLDTFSVVTGASGNPGEKSSEERRSQNVEV